MRKDITLTVVKFKLCSEHSDYVSLHVLNYFFEIAVGLSGCQMALVWPTRGKLG